ncbi:hypothetical protein [Streptomyces virginiae]|uniref:hypothetical protein n=1 Tax=Streptomyces virginiae TaxID=1961 RepID=UPI002252A4F2|nr:hypothetical protein [Streptomyces virginiae]MCX5273739.1 hypothetical protein [Streptomyces virginiae]
MSHSEVPAGAGARKGSWRRRLAVGTAVFSGLCILGVLGTLLMVMYWLHNLTESQKNCCWEQDVTPEWTANTMGFQVPETATDRRAGLHTNVQYDVALLAFTVSTAEADRFLQPLLREGAQMARNRHPEKQGYTRSDGFSHFGLPEPETFTEGMRITSVCPREAKSPESEALRLCAKIHAHEFQPGTTRIYLWAGSDAPLPKPPN